MKEFTGEKPTIEKEWMERISNKKNVRKDLCSAQQLIDEWDVHVRWLFVIYCSSFTFFYIDRDGHAGATRKHTADTYTHTHTTKIDTRRMKTLHLEPWTMKWPINEMNYVTNTARGPIVPRGRTTILFRERKEVEDGPPQTSWTLAKD